LRRRSGEFSRRLDFIGERPAELDVKRFGGVGAAAGELAGGRAEVPGREIGLAGAIGMPLPFCDDRHDG